jgi:formylglycine-generating enzyme required for sulfatase activity
VDGRIYAWGDQLPEQTLVNFGFGWGDTTEVGKYPARSTFGVSDMAGNVSEWINDWYSEKYYSITPPRNPQNLSQSQYRAVRGGAWNSSSSDIRAANRWGYEPNTRNGFIGIRCAR